ncbi:MAG TPA: hypothetical protein VFX02_13785 [Gammaproteobacteria bacterium]|nr:hypothetical protein [Gammaproteobacteria bacterium]
MGLLDGFEKLINEHGSAVILKEHIALANDKYAALERKAAEFEAENKNLKLEVQELRKKLDAFEGATARTDDELDENGQKILLLLSKSRALETAHIAHSLEISTELAEFHVEELSNAGFISGSYSFYEDASYSLDQEGRRYLINAVY